MEEIFMRESLIFSRQLKQEDIIKILNFEEDKKSKLLTKEIDLGEGMENDEQINLKEFSDLIDEFCSLFIQEELNQLNNDMKIILNYFYFRELLIDHFITEKYKDNDNKRHLNIRLDDYLLRVLFEENVSTCEIAKKVNKLILEINESYTNKTNLMDLSDKTYLEKVSKALGTRKIPRFLLREGYRLRREIKKNKEYFEKNTINENEYENKKEINENSTDDENESEGENVSNDNEKYSIKIISKEIANNKKQPFARYLNEIYIMLFFLSLKGIKDEGIYNSIKTNLHKLINYFKIEGFYNFDEFKKKYIDIDEKGLSTEIISLEFSEINKSEYLCKYIIASYNVLINKILKAEKDIYINLLLYLQNYIKEDYKLFKSIVEKELNSILFPDSNSPPPQNYFFHPILNQKFFIFKKPKKYHTTKFFDFNSIKKTFDNSNDSRLKNRFYEIVEEEEKFEIGSNCLFQNVSNLFRKFFKLKKAENEDTIKNHLKLIPYSKNTFEEKTILILISGYLSPNDDHFKEWKPLIKVFKKRFKNPIIYFYNWPSSKFKLSKFLYHWKDFKNARERAKYCGKLLALMLMSNNFFNGFKINIVSFSLGNHLLKNCIKELEKFGRLDILNNIVFMAGATDIKCNFKWEQRLGSIKGAIINCYSDIDYALCYCKKITGKDTIGTKKLKFKNVNIKNYLISIFHILYRKNMEMIGGFFINDLKE